MPPPTPSPAHPVPPSYHLFQLFLFYESQPQPFSTPTDRSLVPTLYSLSLHSINHPTRSPSILRNEYQLKSRFQYKFPHPWPFPSLAYRFPHLGYNSSCLSTVRQLPFHRSTRTRRFTSKISHMTELRIDQVNGRRSIRLAGHDYTRAGAYFITLVTFQREMLFGEI